MKQLLIFAFFLFSTPVFAGKSIRNGGSAVVCRQAESSRAELLDVAEARARDSYWEFGWPVKSSSVEERLAHALDVNLARMSPTRAKFYREEIQQFISEWSFVSGDISRFNDVGNTVIQLPPNCSVKLAVYQTPSSLRPSTKRLVVSSPIFNLMNDDHRAALLLHEVVIAEAAQWNDLKQSANVRPLVALLSSKRMEKVSLEKYLQLLMKARIPTYEANGISMTLLNGVDEFEMPLIEGGNTLLRGFINFGEMLTFPAGSGRFQGPISFYASGAIELAGLASENRFRFARTEIPFPPKTVLKFSEQGEVISAYVHKTRLVNEEIIQELHTWRLDANLPEGYRYTIKQLKTKQ